MSLFTAVFGESSGAASISLHLISDFSKGLFHKAILMSGTAFSPWVIQPVNDLTTRVAKRLGWNGEGGDEACLKVLQEAPSDKLTAAQIETMTLEDIKRSTFLPFTPVVEPYESAQCFLRKSPKELFDSAWSKDLPIIVGNCTEESLLLYRSMTFHFVSFENLTKNCFILSKFLGKFSKNCLICHSKEYCPSFYRSTSLKKMLIRNCVMRSPNK